MDLHSFIVIGERLIGHYSNSIMVGNPFASPLSLKLKINGFPDETVEAVAVLE